MNRFAFAFFTATVLASGAAAQTLDASKLAGRWSGTGEFFKEDLQRTIGSVGFEAVFKADNSGTGRVGGAILQDVRVTTRRDHIEVNAGIAGTIGSNPALAKHRLVLLVTALTDSTLEAEFHLKSNSIFDPTMREGHVVMTRVR